MYYNIYIFWRVHRLFFCLAAILNLLIVKQVHISTSN